MDEKQVTLDGYGRRGYGFGDGYGYGSFDETYGARGDVSCEQVYGKVTKLNIK